MKIILTILLTFILLFTFANIALNVIVLSKLKGIVNVYQTVDSFSQEVNSANEKIKLLIGDIETATDRTGEMSMMQAVFIELTRNEWNAIIKLIDKQEREEKK